MKEGILKLRILLFLIGLAALGSADQPGQPEALFRTDARLVVLNASVFDAQGRLLTGLPPSAFHIYEDGILQQIKTFRQEDTPISLAMVIDRSPSMVTKREKVASAALALIHASNPDDEAFVLNFDVDAYLDQDFTSDSAKLEHGLRQFDAKGGTSMRDAVRLAIEHLQVRGKKDKKVVLVVTDGEDNSSQETLEHLVRVAQQKEILVYAIGLLSEESPQAAERSRRDLNALTGETGGQAWYPGDLRAVEPIAKQIAHEIRNQYVLAYSPSFQDGEGGYRRIRLEVDVPGAAVRTRTGYYAGPGTPASAKNNPAYP